MSPFDVEALKRIYLKKLNSPSVTVGVEIPKYFILNGRIYPLKKTLLTIEKNRKEGLSWRNEALDLLNNLKRCYEREKKRIEEAKDGEGIKRSYKKARGFLRAIQYLQAVLEGEVMEEVSEEKEDINRWIKYVKRLKEK